MKIINYKNFIKEANIANGLTLKHQVFDWDDNILHMETKIIMRYKGEEILVSTSDYAEFRNNPEYEHLPNSFSQFRDDTGIGFNSYFFNDCKFAIDKQNFGPAWQDFLNCLQNGHIFAICTARGHEPISIRTAIMELIINNPKFINKELLIENLKYFTALYDVQDPMHGSFLSDSDLLDSWLDHCEFIGVSSNYFIKKYNLESSPKNTEVGKKMAIEHFVNKCNRYARFINKTIDYIQHNISFSDDDKKTIVHLEELFKELKEKPELKLNGEMNLYLFNTSGRGRTRIDI